MIVVHITPADEESVHTRWYDIEESKDIIDTRLIFQKTEMLGYE